MGGLHRHRKGYTIHPGEVIGGPMGANAPSIPPTVDPSSPPYPTPGHPPLQGKLDLATRHQEASRQAERTLEQLSAIRTESQARVSRLLDYIEELDARLTLTVLQVGGFVRKKTMPRDTYAEVVAIHRAEPPSTSTVDVARVDLDGSRWTETLLVGQIVSAPTCRPRGASLQTPRGLEITDP
jgi:hypothetical protein